ncbi:MAG: SMC-Scp complex subunit ScpB [Acidobacteriaceae bacterium]
MSLKARIEAVIYAAEEPVTLAALASLFREEALALRPAPQPPETPDEPPPSADPEPPIAGEPNQVSDQVSAEGPAETSAQISTDAAAPSEEAERAAARRRDREARDEIRRLIDELIQDYSAPDRGIEIREVAGGFRFATRPEVHDAVRAFVKSLKPPMKLSLQALETLAVIAYKQPVTAPEIGEIRGVDSGGVLGSLVARKLITTAGRKQVIGRPILYKTTKEFLLRFGLRDLNELPSIEEFEKMASELEEENAEAEGDSPSAQDLPFAQNEIDAVEENAESAPDPTPESPSGEAPTSEHDVALEEHQP